MKLLDFVRAVSERINELMVRRNLHLKMDVDMLFIQGGNNRIVVTAYFKKDPFAVYEDYHIGRDKDRYHEKVIWDSSDGDSIESMWNSEFQITSLSSIIMDAVDVTPAFAKWLIKLRTRAGPSWIIFARSSLKAIESKLLVELFGKFSWWSIHECNMVQEQITNELFLSTPFFNFYMFDVGKLNVEAELSPEILKAGLRSHEYFETRTAAFNMYPYDLSWPPSFDLGDLTYQMDLMKMPAIIQNANNRHNRVIFHLGTIKWTDLDTLHEMYQQLKSIPNMDVTWRKVRTSMIGFKVSRGDHKFSLDFDVLGVNYADWVDRLVPARRRNM